MTNVDKCFFCERELKLDWEQIFFNPAHTPETKPTALDFEKLKTCCMGCSDKLKAFMDERETKQASNKDGKLLFFIDDGEFWWYLGDSAEQVIEYHKQSYEGEDTIIDKCEPVSILQALQRNVRLEESDKDGNPMKVIMFDFINDEKWNYENGVAAVASSVF
jgi:hypothetical protein